MAYLVRALRAPTVARVCKQFRYNGGAVCPGDLAQTNYPNRFYSNLAECVISELNSEKRTVEEIPNIRGFETSITGSLATLTRMHDEEKVMVTLDANNSTELDLDEDDDDESEDPSFVPTFTVTVTKPSGDRLEMECSFSGSYGFNQSATSEWQGMVIDSVTVIPASASSHDSLYTADTNYLCEELVQSLKGYLEARGIDQEFAASILPFYRNFEHNAYVENFLGALHKFLNK